MPVRRWGRHCQREQRDNARDRCVVTQAGNAIRDRRGDHPADDGRGHGRGDGPSARGAAECQCRRRARCQAGDQHAEDDEPGRQCLGITGPGRDNVRHYELTSGPCRHGREGPAEGLLRAGAPGLCDKQSQVRAGRDQRAIDLTLRDPGRCAGFAGVATETESPRGGAVQGVLDVAGYRGGADDADRKVMRCRLMESAEGQRDEDRNEGRTGHDEARERTVLGRIPAAVIWAPCCHLRPP